MASEQRENRHNYLICNISCFMGSCAQAESGLMARYLQLLALAGSALLAGAGQALEDEQRNPVRAVELLTGWRHAAVAGEIHTAGIRVVLAPEWKTYWRIPGESGLPPSLDWRGSRNVADARLLFPVPKVYVQDEYQVFGYEHEVVFPVEIRPKDPSREIVFSGTFEFAICHGLCIRNRANLQADLPAWERLPEPVLANALESIKANLRVLGPEHAPECRFGASDDGLHVELELDLDLPDAGEVHVALELPERQFSFGLVESRRIGNAVFAYADLYHTGTGIAAINKSNLLTTVLSGGKAFEVRGCADS